MPQHDWDSARALDQEWLTRCRDRAQQTQAHNLLLIVPWRHPPPNPPPDGRVVPLPRSLEQGRPSTYSPSARRNTKQPCRRPTQTQDPTRKICKIAEVPHRWIRSSIDEG